MLSIFSEINQLKDRSVRRIVGSGAPVDGTSGTGVGDASPGSTYTDYSTGLVYHNFGTKASPVWSAQTSANALKAAVFTFSTAQINAGATALAALAGLKYQLVDWAMISVGGAASGATTVDILATQAAGSVKLGAAAVAGLTQNTLLRAGAANAAILAAGASFASNDANTAITVGKTGGNLATSTAIIVILHYLITS